MVLIGEVVVEGREGVGVNDVGIGGGGDVDVGGDGIVDVVEVFDVGDGGIGEYCGGVNGGVVCVFVMMELRFVCRRRGDEFEEYAIAYVGDYVFESDV